MSTNLEYREKKGREKEKLGYKPGKLNEKKSDREPEQSQNKGDKLCWKNNMKIL